MTIGLLLAALTATAAPLGTAFTYQGRLTDGGQPANDSYEFEFYLFDAETGGTNLGIVTKEEVQVTDGVFTVDLDYGAGAFDGNARWLEIYVRKDNDGQPGAVLTPRQALTAAPYALMAKDVPNGAITSAKLAGGAVTSAKIAAGAVGAASIATGAVGTSHIAAGGVQAANLASGSVGAAQLASGAVTNDKLGAGAAFQNLLASGQSPVGSGGVIMSPLANAAALTGAGYKMIGKADFVDEAWRAAASSPDGEPLFELDYSFSRTVWTGTEILVWGGTSNTGGRYNPVTRVWTPMSTINAPDAHKDFTAVWTGTEMLVWGGRNSSVLNTGFRYNPATDTWSVISTAGAPSARRNHTAVWTGSQMIVWGGSTAASSGVADGGRYNPATNTWTSIAAQSTPNPVTNHTAVWTGSKMMIAGGFGYNGVVDYYTPASNSWTTGPAYQNGSSPYNAFSAVWTGTEMVLADPGRLHRINPVTLNAITVWDGLDTEDVTLIWTGSRVISWGYVQNAGPLGLSYNPATGITSQISQDYVSSSISSTAVWTGSRMAVLGNPGQLFDPAADSWSLMAATSELGSRSSGFSHVWTGQDLIIWGGVDGSGSTVQGGMRFNLAAGSWSLISNTNAPSPRVNHSAVWSGTEMLLWGGATADGEDNFYDGARYNPATNTWTPLPTAGAPGVEGHRAVWTGTEMIVVGVQYSGSIMRGARFNPATNAWTPLPTLNAPALRTNFALLWTGSEVILWGGANGGTANATGGRYNPATNAWTAISLVNAPPGRSNPGVVWTGNQMIVFGGGPDGGAMPSVNARYTPATDSWQTISATGAPTARSGHSMVWDGTQLIVWGGQDGSGAALGDGRLYSPEEDKWTNVLSPNPFSPRTGHAGVWTGNEMLIWGGKNGAIALSSAQNYTPKRTFYFYFRP